MPDRSAEARERVEARFKKAEETARSAQEAMVRYAAEAQAVEDKTLRLRALRLAREQAEALAAPPPKLPKGAKTAKAAKTATAGKAAKPAAAPRKKRAV